MPAPAPIRTACSTCTRAAFFQARIEVQADHEHPRKRANACACHLVDVVQKLRAWARNRQLTGRLTVAAIDPDAQHALPFYSAPITRSGQGSDHG